MQPIITALTFIVIFLIFAIAGAISFIIIYVNTELKFTRKVNHNGTIAKRKRFEELSKEWIEMDSVIDYPLREVLPILDDALTNGFEIKITKDNIYYR